MTAVSFDDRDDGLREPPLTLKWFLMGDNFGIAERPKEREEEMQGEHIVGA